MLAPSTNIIRAELAHSDQASAFGIAARSSNPVLSLCRKLIQAGREPATPLQAFRNDTLCLEIRAIGAAARLEINTKGTGFVRHRAVRAGPPMRQKRLGAA